MICCVNVIFLSNLFIGYAKCQPEGSDKLQKAIWLYEHENYEEALEAFTDLSAADQQSSIIAYYLGMTYKQLQDFLSARKYLEAAVTLSPRINNAFPELINLLYQLNELEEAKKWIAIAEKDSIVPAKIFFLKGLVLLKQGNDSDGAIAAFDAAELFDPGLAGTLMYYKGLAYMQSKRLKEARNAFQNIVTAEPGTDLGQFSNEYINAIVRKEEAEKRLRGSIGAALHYDSNVIQMPEDPAAGSSLTGSKKDWRHVYTAQLDYALMSTDSVALKAGYSAYFAKQFELSYYDTLSQDISFQPSLKHKFGTVATPVHFNKVHLDDRSYLDLAGAGIVNTVPIGSNKLGQLSFQYNFKNYLFAVSQPDEKRDANEFLWSAGWYRFFGKNQDGMVNIRYTGNYDRTKGANWRYWGNRMSVGTTVPVFKKTKLSLAGDYFYQDYTNTNTIYSECRKDNVLTLSSLLAYDLTKDVQLQLSYTYVDTRSSIHVYRYKRDVSGIGIKYSF